MATRSRKGCIDCKQAKIKCDEVHPACGTCARRSRTCRGYLDATGKTKPKSRAGLAQMPCSPRRGGVVRHSHSQSPSHSHSHSSSHSYSHSYSHSPSHSNPKSNSYASPSQLPQTMSPQEPLPAASAPLDAGAMPSMPGDLMAQMGQLDHSSLGFMPSMEHMPAQHLPFQTMPSLQHLQHMQLPTMMPFGLSTAPANAVPANDAANDMSWAPANWPEKIDASYTANTANTASIYPGIYDPSLTLPGMAVYPGPTRTGDDVIDAIDAEFISPGAAAAHASTPCVSLIPSHQTHTFPNGRPLVGPDDRRLLSAAAAARSRSPVLDVSRLWSPPLPAPVRGPSFMPLNEILAEDKPFIEMYFTRHPAEMVMSGSFFINEMNGAVLSLLQVSPIVVSESLCAIGENYVKETPGHNHSTRALGDTGSSAPAATASNAVSHRKTKLLSRLQLLNKDGTGPEIVLLLLLALCGAELTNPQSDGKGSNLAALIDNVAVILERHTGPGRALSTTAQYFAKGLARQDLLHALSRMQRPRIHPSTWLDDYASRHADRLLGLTATLTPILYRLAELAGDVQAILDASQGSGVGGDGRADNTAAPPFYAASLDVPPMDTNLLGGIYADTMLYLTQHADLAAREAAIRAQLLMWRPVHDHALSIQTSRTLLLHASAWRAAALLYLFRLFNRPGSTPDADRTALGMAYEVMMHIHGPAEDVKLSLWPLFVAACELEQAEDRSLATALFNEVCHARPIMTARRTKEFVMEHIWPARDRGDVWDWMQLTHGARPTAFMPL